MAAIEGLSIELDDSGFARIEFIDRSIKGATLKKLNDVGGPHMIDIDTGGTSRTYIVPESIAREAGLLVDEPEGSAPKKATARKAVAPKKATAK